MTHQRDRATEERRKVLCRRPARQTGRASGTAEGMAREGACQMCGARRGAWRAVSGGTHSLRISMSGFSAPVVLKKARCCFSIIRTGLMNGAEPIDAAVAAA